MSRDFEDRGDKEQRLSPSPIIIKVLIHASGRMKKMHHEFSVCPPFNPVNASEKEQVNWIEIENLILSI